MDVVVERCAGLDVHRDNVVATVRVASEDRGRWERHTRTFKATLAGLAELREWLASLAVTLVGMEATGVYWTTAFQALEDRFECWLLTLSTCATFPGGKRMSKTRSGSAIWSRTDLFGRASCRRLRSAGCGI
jgi:transposase